MTKSQIRDLYSIFSPTERLSKEQMHHLSTQTEAIRKTATEFVTRKFPLRSSQEINGLVSIWLFNAMNYNMLH